MNLADLIRTEVAGVVSLTTSREEQKQSYDEKTLVQEELVEDQPQLFGQSVTLGNQKQGENGGRMLITGKARSSLP